MARTPEPFRRPWVRARAGGGLVRLIGASYALIVAWLELGSRIAPNLSLVPHFARGALFSMPLALALLGIAGLLLAFVSARGAKTPMSQMPPASPRPTKPIVGSRESWASILLPLPFLLLGFGLVLFVDNDIVQGVGVVLIVLSLAFPFLQRLIYDEQVDRDADRILRFKEATRVRANGESRYHRMPKAKARRRRG